MLKGQDFPQPAVSTVVFDGYGWERAFDEMAALGVAQVELAFIEGYVSFSERDFTLAKAAAMRSLLDKSGLECPVMSGHVNLGESGAADKIARRLDYARDVGARILITNAATSAEQGQFARNIPRVLRHAEAAGVRIALENPGHGSGNLIGSATDGLALVKHIGSPWLGLNYDICNAYTYSHGQVCPEHDLPVRGSGLIHLHLKDIAQRDGDWVFCAIGSGVIDIAAALDRVDPGIPLSLEMPLRLRRLGRGNPSRAAEPVPLQFIRKSIETSLETVASCRSQHAEKTVKSSGGRQ